MKKKSVWHRKALNPRQVAQRLRRSKERRLVEDADQLEALQFNTPLVSESGLRSFTPTAKGGHPRFHQIVQAMSDLHDRKNSDYAAGMSEGPLGNFERVSKIMALYPKMNWATPFGVCMAFMLKQFDAGFTLKSQNKDSITGEPVSARLTDVAVYTVLGMILDEQANKATGV